MPGANTNFSGLEPNLRMGLSLTLKYMISLKKFYSTNTLAYLSGGSVRKEKRFYGFEAWFSRMSIPKRKKNNYSELKIKKQLDKSAASLQHHAAAWVPRMFYNFYLANNHKIANNSTYTEAREKKAHI